MTHHFPESEAMTKHLPECIYKPENIDAAKGIRWGGSPCICNRLRACEKRVLDAAREAVERLPAHGRVASSLAVSKSKVIEAIDALREKP